MAVVFTLHLPGTTTEQFDAVNAHLMEALAGPPEGLILHLETPTADGVTVMDVWRSQEDFERFAPDVLMPALAAQGIAMSAPPEFRPVHTLFGAAVDETDYAALAATFYDAFTRNDPNVTEMFTEDFVDHEEIPGIPNTRDGVQQWLAMMHGAFSDLTMTAEDVVGLHGTATARVRMTGRHTGEFMGIPPTGRDVAVEGLDLVKLGPDGRCTEHWGFSDQAGLLAQLGASIPQQAAQAQPAPAQSDAG
jgi:predicted ester cyclase